MRMRRYSIWPRSPSRPIGPDPGDRKGSFEQLAVACRAGRAALDHHHELVPVLRLVALQVPVGPGYPVIADLELRPPDVHAAVGVGGGAKLELQDEVPGKLARGPELLDLPVLRGGRDH